MSGADFEYFDRLFSQLRVRSISSTTVIMVLPEAAEIFAISRRAAKHHLKLKTLKVNMIKGERVVLYEVVVDE
jgi:preprotein translocase subunit YajC